MRLSIRKLSPIFLSISFIILILLLPVRVANVQESTAEASPAPAYLGQYGAVKVEIVGMDGKTGLCNSVSFYQVPNFPDYFVGRILINTNPKDLCSGDSWSLAMFKMDWNKNQLQMVNYIFQPNKVTQAPFITNNTRINATLTTSYDPTVAFYNNEYWIAFECGGHGHPNWDLGPSSCVGHLDISKGIDKAFVDPGNISVVVKGQDSDPNSGYRYSASIPKLFVFQNKVYLYWGAIKHNKFGWQHTSIRGMEIGEDPNTKLIWGRDRKGKMAGTPLVGRTLASHDPSQNDEVVATGSDNQTDAVAGLEGVFPWNNKIYLLAALGGINNDATCLRPLTDNVGCFHLQVFRSSNPLGDRTFNHEVLSSPGLLKEPQSYNHLVIDPKGDYSLMGWYFYPPARFPASPVLPSSGNSDPAGRRVNGEWRYPLDMNWLQFKAQ